MKRLNILGGILTVLVLGLTVFYFNYKHSVEDHNPPVIEIQQDVIECSLEATTEELIQGLIATDDKDGDLTGHIIVNDIRIREDEGEDASENSEDAAAEEATQSSSSQKEFEISYIVFDSSNNIGYASRTLIYTDYHSPRFHLNGKLRFGATTAVNFYELLTAEDCIDGDISNNISVEMSDAYLNAFSFGTYDCTVSVTNSVGDVSELPLQFEVVDTASETEANKPELYLKEYLVYLKKGEKLDKKSYIEWITIDNEAYEIVSDDELYVEGTVPVSSGYTNRNYKRFIPISQVKMSSNVQKDTPGLYEVEYSFRNPQEGTRGTAKLMVIVEE